MHSLSGLWALWADRRQIIYRRVKAAGLQHACTANEASSVCVCVCVCRFVICSVFRCVSVTPENIFVCMCVCACERENGVRENFSEDSKGGPFYLLLEQISKWHNGQKRRQFCNQPVKLCTLRTLGHFSHTWNFDTRYTSKLWRTYKNLSANGFSQKSKWQTKQCAMQEKTGSVWNSKNIVIICRWCHNFSAKWKL